MKSALLSLVGSRILWGDSLSSLMDVKCSCIARSNFVSAKMELRNEMCQ
ncbi:MAG: hypothetical protein J6U83_06415 [Bacteroidales bacterium]|nr:hypothetical protein [Bacteroidales bacterium]MBO7269367.1 hypothetical protein [Bacteroidales bacterium]